MVQPLRSPDPSLLHFYPWGHIVPSASFENEEALHHHISDVCQTIRNRHGTFKKVRQYMIRRVHSCIDPGERYFEPLFRIVA